MKKILFLILILVPMVIYFNQDRTTPQVLIKSFEDNQIKYEYEQNTLYKVTMPNRIIEYDLDEFNRYKSKSINGKIVEKYVWLENNKLLAILNELDEVQQTFYYKNKNNLLPYRMEQNTQEYYFIYNKMKNLKVIIDSKKKIVKIITYDLQGNLIKDSNPSFFVPMNFAGGLYDKDAQLLFFKEGIYNPKKGKWLTRINDHNIIKNLQTLNNLQAGDVFQCSMTLDTYYHSYLCVKGQCGGLYANDYLNYFNGTGEIIDNSNYFKKSMCKKIEKKKTVYDQKIFSQCVSKQIQPRRVDYFDALRHNCHDEIKDIITQCSKEAKIKGNE